MNRSSADQKATLSQCFKSFWHWAQATFYDLLRPFLSRHHVDCLQSISSHRQLQAVEQVYPVRLQVLHRFQVNSNIFSVIWSGYQTSQRRFLFSQGVFHFLLFVTCWKQSPVICCMDATHVTVSARPKGGKTWRVVTEKQILLWPSYRGTRVRYRELLLCAAAYRTYLCDSFQKRRTSKWRQGALAFVLLCNLEVLSEPWNRGRVWSIWSEVVWRTYV